MNKEFLRSFGGILRLVTLVLGVIVLGLVASSFNFRDYRDRYFLASVVILLPISGVLLVIHILGILHDSGVFYIADFGYHVLGGLLLKSGGIAWFVSVRDHSHFVSCSGSGNDIVCRDLETQRIIAGILGLLNAFLYFMIAATSFKKAFGAPQPQPPSPQTPDLVEPHPPSAPQVAVTPHLVPPPPTSPPDVPEAPNLIPPPPPPLPQPQKAQTPFLTSLPPPPPPPPLSA